MNTGHLRGKLDEGCQWRWVNIWPCLPCGTLVVENAHRAMCTRQSTASNHSGCQDVSHWIIGGGKEWKHTTHKGYQTSLDTRMPKVCYNTGLASKTNNEPHTNVAHHPAVPVSISHTPKSLFFSPFILRPPIWHKGPRPMAHWYMFTNGDHYNYSPLIWVMSLSLITFLQLVCILSRISGVVLVV